MLCSAACFFAHLAALLECLCRLLCFFVYSSKLDCLLLTVLVCSICLRVFACHAVLYFALARCACCPRCLVVFVALPGALVACFDYSICINARSHRLLAPFLCLLAGLLARMVSRWRAGSTTLLVLSPPARLSRGGATSRARCVGQGRLKV